SRAPYVEGQPPAAGDPRLLTLARRDLLEERLTAVSADTLFVAQGDAVACVDVATGLVRASQRFGDSTVTLLGTGEGAVSRVVPSKEAPAQLRPSQLPASLLMIGSSNSAANCQAEYPSQASCQSICSRPKARI
ncbi:MAG: hypothetical protein ACK4N5_15015, partial [Myxococcales bacterium]